MVSDFKQYKVSEFAEVIGGGTPKTKVSRFWNGSIPWLTPKDLSNFQGRFVSRGARSISHEGLQKSSARMLPKGSVLLSSRAPIGYVAIAKNEISTNQGFRNLVVKDGFYSEFIYYLLIQNVDYLKQHASGSTFQELSGSTLENLTFKIPSLLEQRAIACILGALDDKIEVNRRMNETLEAMARALFKSWFVDFDPVRAKAEGQQPHGLPPHIADLFPDSFEDSELGEIPKGWKVGCVGEIAQVSSGKRPAVRYSERSDEASVPLWGGNGPMAFVHKPLYEEPILLTGRVGTLGSVFRITDPCWPSDNTLILRTNESSVFQFLFLQLQQINFASLNVGSTQPLLTQTDLKAQRMVIPKKNILQVFSRIVNSMHCRLDQSTAESEILAALRDTLLPKLISGELRVPDAERIVERCL